MDRVLGIDVGGTSIKVGLFTPEGELLEERKIPTPALVGQVAYDVVTDGITRVLTAHDSVPNDVIACGLDIPGPVADDGTVGFLPNIELDPEGLVGAISAVFSHATVAFVNDANAAALGEMWAGVAHGTSSFVFIALGTGVGAGVVANGRLIAGAFGAGGEVGHITVNKDETLVCGCGRRGCLEQYASAKGIVRLYLAECERRGVTPVPIEHATDTLSVFRALAAGDDCAKLAVDQMCEYLALAMSQISCVVDPAMYLIGGGVAGAFATFAPALRARFLARALPTCRGVRIEAASLGNQAAMYGCAYEALRLHGELS
ncbi:ROK family protein [Thermophilibacter immobilis]|uniref:ROK family protein n=1 Tax=Thermophilibacter immobilis TaxID=2779519 RepID=A0A7S7RUZ7_9ACTN|nr:ROK family protein [Thermophilibacter immobilis]QOY60962.1 ROK family protein [Thermophilibacter immobilis]